MKKRNYYLGLDIGTNSVGYAVSDDQYNILKFHGEPAWGVTTFDQASLCDEQRSFRSARRRLDRKQQRVGLIRELFASEVSKVDPRFYIRLKGSHLYRDDAGDRYTVFTDPGFTDKEYYKKYPTVHHLIQDLIDNKEPHDVRLVYLACAWLVAHRGHFLSKINMDNLSELKDFDKTYGRFMQFFADNGFEAPWGEIDADEFGNVLKKKTGINNKNKMLKTILYGNKKPSKETSAEFPFNRDTIVKLLAGGTCKLKDIFGNDAYDEFGSISLGMDEDKFGEVMANIGEDYDLIACLRDLFDWATLVDLLGQFDTISASKINIYEQHKVDLNYLKYFVKKYLPKKYSEIFREIGKDNYVAYSYHTNDGDTSKLKKKTIEEFSKYILGVVKKVTPEDEDLDSYNDMISRLELCTFMPKQKNTNNRVIPYQLYGYELKKILDNASAYLPFLCEKDEDGISVMEKVFSVFVFRIPYFVGPLNPHSKHAWIERRAGKIYPWNFEKIVDLDKSEQNFIQKMTNYCTYLPGEAVLPKDSLLYHKFTVLNEINNIKINGVKIDVELKQQLYNELFMFVKRVTKKKVLDFFISNGVIRKGEEDSVTGIDVNINSNLSSQIAFKRLIESGALSVDDVEQIIERSTYADDKSRLRKWLDREYPLLSEEDKRYICRVKIKDFGRLSAKFLTDFEGASKDTGEITTIIRTLWETQDNLMEILSDKYTFKKGLDEYRKEYYMAHPVTLDARLDEMYISNSVRRPIYRTLAIIKDVVKAFGKPEKIFVEMTRGADEEQKGRRTKTRKQQILDLYQLCKDEDVRHLKQQLEAMGEYADNKLQGDKLFLYYMQLGKCMYSGKPIELEKLGTKLYDIDHIFPQAYVKDDSIINNKVLVLSDENGKKSDKYPISEDIRSKMSGFWFGLKEKGLISETKYKRLVRNKPFSEEEKWGFINRQMTETSQSTKAVATILKEKYPDAEIVYSKAKLVSEFRHEFGIDKSRLYNDLHHAVDAYLNIVTGNVYDNRFTKKWFNVNSHYSIKVKTLFTNPLICNGKTIWDGQEMLKKVKKNSLKNTAHFTKYAFFKKGGLFDQMPVPASDGLVPRKKDLPTEKYGGYNKAGAMFYIPVKYKAGKKSEVIIMSVEMLFGDRFLEDVDFAREYAFIRLKHILNKDVDDVSFPMGMRPWKVNTMLSLDGFRICITGIGSGGKTLVAQPVMQFSSDPFWQYYLKKLEKIVEKKKSNPRYIYDEEYDKVTYDNNLKLYDYYITKYENSIYKKRVNAPIDTLKKGKSTFEGLDVFEQSQILLNIHSTYGRMTSGIDLKLIGGVGKAAATVSFSASISNWKKKYSEVCLIDCSPAGLWEKQSDNLLELL